MMKGLPSLAAAALFALAACNNSSAITDEANSGAGVDHTVANAAPIVLPPSIKTEATLRCKDNSLVHVTFFTGDTQASVATPPGATPVTLTAGTAGEAFAADGGWSLTGDAKAVTLTQPDKPEQTCKA